MAKIILLAIVILLFSQSCSTTGKDAPKDSLPKKVESVTIPFILHDNRILLDVMINGKGPYKFIFDTGGSRSNSLTPEVAKELGLKVTKAENARGAGSNSVEAGTTTVENYSVGKLVARNQTMHVLDYSEIKRAFSFPRLDGIIGFDVLKKSITCIDNENKQITFKDGEADCFPNAERFVIPFRLDHDTPVISGKVNGIPTEFIVDTGDRSAFSLFQKFAASSGLNRNFKGQPELITGVGIGGTIPAQLATLDEIQIGNRIKMKSVLSRLPSTTGGFFARSKLGGSVGNEILRRFNVIFNYPKNEMILVPNNHFEELYKFTPPQLSSEK
ncbi:MAG: retropepsin-like aspartic protease [Bdellovibrionota bacterium]